jgi:uncharacterized protein (DUF697 family)
MGFFDFVKRIGKSVVKGVRRIGKTVSDIGRPIHRTIKKGYNFVKHIPVIGSAVANTPVGKTIESALDVSDKALNVAEKFGDGDMKGGAMGMYNAYKNK